MRRVELGMVAAMGTADRLHRVGVLPAPASDLAFVAFPWAVSPAHCWVAAGCRSTTTRRASACCWTPIRGSHAVAARQAGPQGCGSRGGQRRGGPGGHRSDHAGDAARKVRQHDRAGRPPSVSDEAAVVLCDVRDEPLSVDEVLGLVRHPQCGGIALFVGRGARPRPRCGGVALDYSAHPSVGRDAGAGMQRGRRPPPRRPPRRRCTAWGTSRSATGGGGGGLGAAPRRGLRGLP